MPLNLADQFSMKTYFGGIATSHVDINGFKFGDKDVVRNDVRSGMEGIILWADRPEPVKIRNKYDSYLGAYKSTIMVISGLPAEKSKQDDHYRDHEIIATQIISRLIKDHTEGLIETDVEEYTFGQAEITLGSTKFGGCRIDLQWFNPVDVTYDQAKWV